jgi:hypothetical protein
MRKILLAFAALSVAAPVAAPTAAGARVRPKSPPNLNTCHRNKGTTGMIVGGAAGALAGAAVTHGSTGPIVGAAGGALLGRHIQRHNSRYRC